MSGSDRQLCEGAAEFRLITEADLTGGWNVEVSAGSLQYAADRMGVAPDDLLPCVVVELPDYPWAWKYQQWACQNYVDGALPVMVVGPEEYRGQGRAACQAAARETYRSIFETGRPAPFYARIFAIRGIYLREGSGAEQTIGFF